MRLVSPARSCAGEPFDSGFPMPVRIPGGRVAALGLVAALSSLSACVAPPVAIAPTARAAIHTVRVNPVVTLPHDLYYVGPATGLAMLAAGPGPGQPAPVGNPMSAKNQMVAEIAANHIDVGAIVAAEFARQASAGTPVAFVTGSAPADAQVDLVVNVYGVSQTHPMGTTLYPVLSLSVTMKAADGTVVWQASHAVGSQNLANQDGHTMEDYLKNPELLRQAFANGADAVSRLMVEDYLSAPQSRPGHLG